MKSRLCMKSYSKMDEYEYELICPMCDTAVQLKVIHIDEKPINCPMCGTEAEWDSLDE